MAKKKKRRQPAWKSVQFKRKRKPASETVLGSYPVDLTDGLYDFLSWQNGGVPVKPCFRMDCPEVGETVGIVEQLYGVGTRDEDIAEAILRYRDDLPRWSVPIGRADDESFLLTFAYGDRLGEVWYRIWLHDGDMESHERDDLSEDCFVAKSLDTFFAGLMTEEEAGFEE